MFRVGQSTDIHVLVEGRKCILGGVEIPHNKGLLGHSDADVLLHVVAESILGALGLGDLGEHFSDLDPQFKDISSVTILKDIVTQMKEKGYHVINIDTLLLCQRPKLLPFKPEMRSNIAKLLEVSEDVVNVKATTGEKLGFVGREEGIMAQAVVMLGKNA